MIVVSRATSTTLPSRATTFPVCFTVSPAGYFGRETFISAMTLLKTTSRSAA